MRTLTNVQMRLGQRDGERLLPACGTSLGTPLRAVTPPRPPVAALPGLPRRRRTARHPPQTAPPPRAARLRRRCCVRPAGSSGHPSTGGRSGCLRNGKHAGAGLPAGFWNEIRQSVTLTVIAVCTSVFLLFSFLDLPDHEPGQALSWFGLSYRGLRNGCCSSAFHGAVCACRLFHLASTCCRFTGSARWWKRGWENDAISSYRRFAHWPPCWRSWLSPGRFRRRVRLLGSGLRILTAAAIFQPDASSTFTAFFPEDEVRRPGTGGIELMLMLNSGAGQGGAHGHT